MISYINLALGMAVNLFITPLLIASLGDVDYSIYKVMQSFAGPLTMFHLGISAIVTRSIIKCQTIDDYTQKDKQNTMAHALMASGAMSAFVAAAGAVMYCLIPSVYGENYDPATISLGQSLFIVFVISSVFHMMTDAFSGCLVGHEKFIVTAVVQLIRNIVKPVLMILLLQLGMGAFGAVCVDLIISVGTFLFNAIYSFVVLHEKPKLYFFDRKQIVEIILFGSAILLQAVVNQINNNVDTMILGAMIREKSIITMYSSALAIYAVYNSLITVISNFFLPKATRLVLRNASGAELTDFVIGPGRYQAMIAVGVICGFALFGKNFISVWIGERYMDAYWVTLILMIPVTIPLVENVAISILDATLKRMYRSVVLCVMAVINVAASIVMVRYLGFWGAALGTVFSLIIGHGILMNIYYAKTFHMQIGRMFYSIFKGILPAGLAASIPCIPLAIYLPNTVLFFLLKCLCFLIIYAVCLGLFGMNKSEKALIGGGIKKIWKRLFNV